MPVLVILPLTPSLVLVTDPHVNGHGTPVADQLPLLPSPLPPPCRRRMPCSRISGRVWRIFLIVCSIIHVSEALTRIPSSNTNPSSPDLCLYRSFSWASNSPSQASSFFISFSPPST